LDTFRICIIGCGYVGKAAAIKWKYDNHEITVTTRSLNKAYDLRPFADLVYILGENWHDLIEKQDIVLLCVAPDKNSDYLNTYLRTAELLVDSLKNSEVKQVIYTSSISIYGDFQGKWVDEDHIPKPQNANAQILLATEQILLKAATQDRKVCIFRLGEIYGPERSLVDRVYRMQGIHAPGNGESYTNLIHLDEILMALDIAVQSNLNGIFNLCNDVHIPRKQLYEHICQKHQFSSVHWNPMLTSTHMGNKRISNQKLKSKGWVPHQQLEQILVNV